MDEAEGLPWARKYQGITLPWSCSLDEVDESMSTVGIIIMESLHVSSICRSPRVTRARPRRESRKRRENMSHRKLLTRLSS